MVTPLKSQNGSINISSETVNSRESIVPTWSSDTIDHRRRHMHLQSLERTLAYLVSNDLNSVTEQTIRLRLDQLKENWHSFQDAHLKVIGIVVEHELAENDEIRAHAESIFLQAAEKLEFQNVTLQQTKNARIAMPIAGNNVVRVEVGDTGFRDRIVAFDGNFAKWATFRDSFTAAVLDRAELGPVQKLLRLHQSVTGMAAAVLGEWALVPDNLPLAWAQLCKAYDNEYQTIRAHVKELFEMPTVPTESYLGIRNLINTVTNTTRQLASLLEAQEQCECMIMYMLEERMPSSTRTAWEMYRSTSTRPRLSEMLACLERRATGLAGVSSTAKADSGYIIKSRSNDTINALTQLKANDRNRRPRVRTQLPPCPLCQADHGLFKCEEFLRMKLGSRLDFVRGNRLCQICLRLGHVTEKCPKPQYTCKKCPGEMHNTLVCSKYRQPIGEFAEDTKNASHVKPAMSHSLVSIANGQDAE